MAEKIKPAFHGSLNEEEGEQPKPIFSGVPVDVFQDSEISEPELVKPSLLSRAGAWVAKQFEPSDLEVLHTAISSKNLGGPEITQESIVNHIKSMSDEDFGKLLQMKYRRVLGDAIYHGHTEIAQALIDRMSDEHLGTLLKVQGSYVLHTAIVREHTEIAKVLISRMSKEQLNVRNPDSEYPTVLASALSYGEQEIALAIIEKIDPSDLAIRNRHQETPLQIAIEKGQQKVALAIVNKATTNELSQQLMHAIHYSRDNDVVVKAIVDHLGGKELSQIKDGTGTPLLWAAKFGYEGVVRALAEKLPREQVEKERDYIQKGLNSRFLGASVGDGQRPSMESAVRILNDHLSRVHMSRVHSLQ